MGAQHFTTAGGGSIEARHIGGDYYDVHVRNAAGDSIATVETTMTELRAMLAKADRG